ncbi:MAG: hypothetical protein AAFO99_06200 [Bacteroidota bacterium]
METAKTTCCKRKMASVEKANKPHGVMSFFSTLLLILLPKCPLCITAYMGAILMFFDIKKSEMGPFLMHSKPILGGIILLMILLNYKGKKTVLSASLVVASLTLLILSTYFYVLIVPDSLLYAFFVFAIWYNGNFEYFYRFIWSRVQRVLNYVDIGFREI